MGEKRFNFDITEPKGRVEEYTNRWRNSEDLYLGFDARLMKEQLRVISASGWPQPITIYEMTIPDYLCSRLNLLHGGAVALIVDMTTTAAQAPIAQAHFWPFGGLTRSLNIKYLRSAPLGTVIRIEAEVIHVGKKMALIRATVKRKSDDVVLYTAEHEKFNTGVVTGCL